MLGHPHAEAQEQVTRGEARDLDDLLRFRGRRLPFASDSLHCQEMCSTKRAKPIASFGGIRSIRARTSSRCDSALRAERHRIPRSRLFASAAGHCTHCDTSCLVVRQGVTNHLEGRGLDTALGRAKSAIRGALPSLTVWPLSCARGPRFPASTHRVVVSSSDLYQDALYTIQAHADSTRQGWGPRPDALRRV